MIKLLLISLFFNAPFLCFAQTVKKTNQGYKVLMEDIDLPKKTLNKAFKSGLKTELLYTISVVSGKKELLLERGLINVRYDLWDEVFEVSKSKGKAFKFKNLSEVYNHIENRSIKISAENSLAFSAEAIKLKTVFLLNPINKEKSKKIKEWIAEKNVGKSSVGRGIDAGSSGTIFTGIVNRVVMGELDKDIYGADKRFEFLSPEIDLRRVK
ncbi:MAG: hypothetical protein ACRBBP_07165 [Bdellovibrionales bacterium]